VKSVKNYIRLTVTNSQFTIMHTLITGVSFPRFRAPRRRRRREAKAKGRPKAKAAMGTGSWKTGGEHLGEESTRVGLRYCGVSLAYEQVLSILSFSCPSA